MKTIIKGFTAIIAILIYAIVFILFIKSPSPNESEKTNSQGDISNLFVPYTLNNNQITYMDNTKINTTINTNTDANKEIVLNRAKAMTEVKWIAAYNMTDVEGHYTFLKGITYTGIPYSMGQYQVSSPNDFLSKINKTNKIIGNDCSGFVSACWGIKRQTTLTLFDAIKKMSKVDGKAISLITWEELEPGDALMIENGKGKGHIILIKNIETNNKDLIHVYEQNIGTVMPFEPLPVAREDTRSEKTLKSEGYFPIRLIV